MQAIGLPRAAGLRLPWGIEADETGLSEMLKPRPGPSTAAGLSLPLSSRVLRPDISAGHPNDTLWNISESGSSPSCVTVSRTTSMNGSTLIELLLMDAQARVHEISKRAGVRAMMLDARTERLARWYEAYDFIRFPNQIAHVQEHRCDTEVDVD